MAVESQPALRAGRQAVVKLPDEIAFANAGQVRSALERALADGASVVIADLSATGFCASEGVRVLICVNAAANAAGAQLRLAAPGHAVRRVLELTAADQVLRLYPSVEAARAGSA